MTARPQEPTTAPDEEAALHEWRISQFRVLGFSETEAYRLARRPEVDVASVRALVAKGCPRDTANRIVT